MPKASKKMKRKQKKLPVYVPVITVTKLTWPYDITWPDVIVTGKKVTYNLQEQQFPDETEEKYQAEPEVVPELEPYDLDNIPLPRTINPYLAMMA